MNDGVIRLDAAQYNLLWRRRGGEKHPLHATLDHGTTWEERYAIDAAARRRLREAGYVDAHDDLEPGLADLLGVLARADAEIDVHVWSREGVRATTVGSRGDLAVVAALDDDGGLRLTRVPPTHLPGALLAWVPDAPALAGSPMTVPADALSGRSAGSGGPDAGWESGLRRAAVPRPTAQRLLAMGARPPLRRLQFGVTRRGTYGRRCRGPVLNVIDTAEGRVALRPIGAQLLVRPADRSWLRDELARLLAACPTD